MICSRWNGLAIHSLTENHHCYCWQHMILKWEEHIEFYVLQIFWLSSIPQGVFLLGVVEMDTQLDSFLWIIGCFFPSLHGNSNNNKSCMYFSWQMTFVQFMMGLLKDFSLRDYLYVLWDKTIRSIWSLLIEFYFGYNSLLYPYKKKNLHKERVQTANHAHYQSWFSCWRRGLRKTLFFSLLIEIHIEQYFMENSCCVSFFTLCLHDIYWLYWEQINAVHNLTESWLVHVLCSPIATLVYTA